MLIELFERHTLVILWSIVPVDLTGFKKYNKENVKYEIEDFYSQMLMMKAWREEICSIVLMWPEQRSSWQ